MIKDSLEIYWNLDNLLYQKKILKVTEFQDGMRQHGVSLSYAQAHALANEQPLRVTLRVVLAICQLLDCSVNDLIVIRKRSGEQAEPSELTGDKKTTEIKRIPKKLIGKKLTFDEAR